MLIDQFRSFYYKTFPYDIEHLVEYFAVFGGLNKEIDITYPLEELIEEFILKDFTNLSQKIDALLLHERNNHKLLHALAVGDRRIFSAFKRAHLNNANGGATLNYLLEKGLVQIEYSREEDPREQNPNMKLKREEARHRISHKFLFTYPFIRFWFYFIYPHAKEIKNGNFHKMLEDFKERQNSFTSFVFEELCEILLNYNLRESQIVTSGSYWDAKVEIDILTFTDNQKVYVAECKWTNHKVNKKELHKLMEKCEKIEIKPTQMIFFSKRGFSKELLAMQGKEIALYTAEDFKALLKTKPPELESLLDF